MRLTASIVPEAGGYVSQCLEGDVASQGDTIEEAIANLREALALHFEDRELPAEIVPAIIAPIEVVRAA